MLQSIKEIFAIKSNSKNLFKIVIGLATLVGVITMGNVSFASDDNIEYGFTIKANYANSYTTKRYRQTKSAENPWKVNLKRSDEGSGTLTTFWISYDALEGNTLGSGTYKVKQGSGAKYFGARWHASKQNVKLSAENNNYSANTYWVEGTWDEETW